MNLITWNNYFTVGIVIALAHATYMAFTMPSLAAKSPSATTFFFLIALFVWPVIPFVWLYARKQVKHDLSLLKMQKAMREHIKGRPYILVVYDAENENLHMWGNGDAKERSLLLRNAIKANDGLLGEPKDGNH